MSATLELLDWRRRVAELFAELRRRPADDTTLSWFRAEKDALFKHHPQSPIPAAERAKFAGLAYWPFDPEARVIARFTPAEPTAESPPHPPLRGTLSPWAEGWGEGAAEAEYTRVGSLTFELYGAQYELAALWITGYAGGLFVPFKDATSGHQTYGGGRYLLDTIKSADLGSDAASDTVVLDFNYAYHPSCAYDPIWVCPLAPPDSRLPIPIHAGEQSR